MITFLCVLTLGVFIVYLFTRIRKNKRTIRRLEARLRQRRA